MRQVTEQEFFAVINPLDVHPRPMKTIDGRYCPSDWEMRDGSRRLVGRSLSDSHDVEPDQYWLAQ